MGLRSRFCILADIVWYGPILGQADWLASKADFTACLKTGWSELLRGLRHTLGKDSLGSGIKEAYDRQVTTVFTVQPSFHHRHSTKRVS